MFFLHYSYTLRRDNSHMLERFEWLRTEQELFGFESVLRDVLVPYLEDSWSRQPQLLIEDRRSLMRYVVGDPEDVDPVYGMLWWPPGGHYLQQVYYQPYEALFFAEDDRRLTTMRPEGLRKAPRSISIVHLD